MELRFIRKCLILFSRDRFTEDLAEEMAFHREQAARDLQAAGMTPTNAQFAATRQFGNAARLKEESLDAVAFGFETALQDVRYAVRQLRSNPGFACTAVLILALGIGATTAIFSAVNPILFEPLPYPHPRRLAMVWEGKGGGGRMVNFAIFHGIATQSRSFDAVAAMKAWQPTMTGPTQPERFEGQRVSAAYFDVLGVPPALGRSFQPSDDVFHGPNVVILSHALWQRRFDSDPAIVGRAITLDDQSFTVVGVMPAEFENVLAPEAQIWAPLQYNPALDPNTREWGHHLRVVGRLRAGVGRSQAAAEAGTIIHSLAQAYAQGFANSGGAPDGFIIDSLQDDITADVRPALLAVLGAVVLALIIACVNVTNLLLARAAQRRGEFAMRAALGAAKRRLVRQLLTESLLLAVVAGAFGFLIAAWGVRALIALSPPDLPRVGAIRLDAAVFLFGLAVTTLIGLAVGLVPALHASRANLHSGMQQISHRTAGGHQATRRALVVSEVALALVLLVSAGLLLRSLQRLFSTDPGFDASHVLTMQVDEASQRYNPDLARLTFFRQALDAVRAVPGVESAAFTSQLPLSGDLDIYGIGFEKDARNGSPELPALRYAVTPDYFTTMHIPLRRGRFFNERDTTGAPRVAIIDESLAKRKFGSDDPIGRRVCLRCMPGEQPWSTIVGVVADVKQSSLAIGEEDAFYVPNSQWYWADNVMSLVVRTRADAATLTPSIRSAIWSIDKDQPIVRVATMKHLLAASEAKRSFTLIAFEIFGLVGLILAATGIYGVLSGTVTERTREIGVRAALGATRSNILGLFVRQGLTMTALGLAIGFAGALAATRALITLLFGVSRLDPLTYFAVLALLLTVSLLACWMPAWRATQVDPAITLRAE
jgi:putative ABC transport system permease protein